MKSILTKLTMGLLCVSLAAAPAGAAIERKAKPQTESTTPSTAQAVASAAKSYTANKISRTQKRDARKALKGMLRDGVDNKLLLVIVAILLPPLAVFLHQDEFNTKVLIALILWLLFYVPGLIYALIVILGKD